MMFDNHPHAPLHWFKGEGHYIITAGTFRKEHFFRSAADLDYLQTTFFAIAKEFGYELHAWSFFPNHYHGVVKALEDLSRFAKKLHSITAIEINRRAETPGRKVWYQYWDTLLTTERAYLSRLNYVNQNPVHHGIATVATQYKWCSASWVEATAKTSLLRALHQFDQSRVSLPDNF